MKFSTRILRLYVSQLPIQILKKHLSGKGVRSLTYQRDALCHVQLVLVDVVVTLCRLRRLSGHLKVPWQ